MQSNTIGYESTFKPVESSSSKLTPATNWEISLPKRPYSRVVREAAILADGLVTHGALSICCVSRGSVRWQRYHLHLLSGCSSAIFISGMRSCLRTFYPVLVRCHWIQNILHIGISILWIQILICPTASHFERDVKDIFAHLCILGFIFRRNSCRNSRFRGTSGHFVRNLLCAFFRNFGLSFSPRDMKHDPTRSRSVKKGCFRPILRS